MLPGPGKGKDRAMKIENVHHIAINTLDIEKSVAYYEKMFGFKEESRADMGDCTLVYLKVCQGTYLELFDLRGGCERGTRPEALQGLRHIAFGCEDIEAWNAALKEKGAKFTMELCDMEQIGKRGLLIEDPNGVILELSEDIR